MHQNDCEHTHTHTHTLTKAHKYTHLSSCISCEGGVLCQVKVRSNSRVQFDGLHSVHVYARGFARGTEFALCPCVLVYDTWYHVRPPSRQIQPDSRLGQGGRGVPLRDSITALFVKQSWQPGERGGERMSEARGFKGRGVKISTKEIQEVVISTKQTDSQGRGSGHNMGGCSISSELCSVHHCTAWAAIYMRSSMYGH